VRHRQRDGRLALKQRIDQARFARAGRRGDDEQGAFERIAGSMGIHADRVRSHAVATRRGILPPERSGQARGRQQGNDGLALIVEV
jgi:hypothetical protein